MDSDDDLADIEIVVDNNMSRGAPLVAPGSSFGLAGSDDRILRIAGPPSAANAAAVPPAVAMARFLLANERRCFTFSVLGYVQHGKTSLISTVFGVPRNACKDDAARGTTTQCRVFSSVASGAADKSSLMVSMVDCPGDPAFTCDVRAGVSLSTNCLFCIDAVEGLHPGAEDLLRYAFAERCRVVIVFTKMDRLVTELRLPPRDAYKHLKTIVDAINVVAASAQRNFSVTRGDVIFTSTIFGAAFSVPSMAEKYAAQHAGRLDPVGLAKRLWGSIAFDRDSRKFCAVSPANPNSAFVDFVLEPFYKVVAVTLSGDTYFTSKQHHETAAAAVVNAVDGTFGKFAPTFIDCVLTSSVRCGADSELGRVAATLDQWYDATATPKPQLLAVAPLAATSGASDIFSLVRVDRGKLRVGAKVSVVTGVDSIFPATVSGISVRTVDGLISVSELGRGAVGYVEGLSDCREGQYAFIIGEDDVPPSIPASPANPHAIPRVHVALEPVKLEWAKQLQDALRVVVALHPGCAVQVEDAGDQILLGSSELYLDVALHELRQRLLGVDRPIRLSDPYVAFAETVAAPRGVLRSAQSDDGSISLSIVASPMPSKLVEGFENGSLSFAMPKDRLTEALRVEHNWDEVAAESVVAVGPDRFFGPNVLRNDVLGVNLLDDTLPADALEAIATGFRTCSRRGPICGEAIRGVMFTLVELTLPSGRMTRQALTTLSNLSRNACKAAFLSAAPRVMEPYVTFNIITKPSHSAEIAGVLARRRGNITAEIGLPSTPLSRVQCILPMIDSFGFESEVRLLSRDAVLCTSAFAHWSVVPGDPMDDSATLLPLQSATGAQLARDFALKTRRKKGMPDAMELL